MCMIVSRRASGNVVPLGHLTSYNSFIRVVWRVPKRSQQRRAFSSSSELRVLDVETDCLPYLGRVVQDLW